MRNNILPDGNIAMKHSILLIIISQSWSAVGESDESMLYQCNSCYIKLIDEEKKIQENFIL